MALTERDDWLEAARAADRVRGEAAMAPAAEARIRAGIRARGTARRGSARAFGFAFSLGVAASLLGSMALRPPEPRPTARPMVKGFEPAEEPCAARAEGDLLRLEGSCRLRISAPALTLSTDHSAEIKRVGGALYVLRGWVSFEVDKVAAGQAPTRVVVSGGTIEVLGTRFIVFEEGGAGHVDLLEGAISFVAHTGGATPIEPGHRLSWRASTGSSSVEAEASEAPPATPMAPASASSGPVRRAPIRVSGPAAAHEAVQPDPPAPEPDLRSALRHIARLRAAGRSSEALARLTELLVQHAGDRQVREVLSFERIRVLADELGEQESACRAIRDHRAEFGEESYRSAIVAIELKRCPGW